ncbi:hypothetical protein SAMN04489712_10956 [Thermomonospora echinospora]|uniref:Uncharacterized protein n=1 Tax=Thermomonospora echinospora TaxID=1992 RepID=A0A1H6C8C2_9ACTN|nr:hypothetical protein [Thermomonospora echinospora]SEG69158.1 hypothetical protein SAMN04489712_10956 [Thermomonospora echinospora]
MSGPATTERLFSWTVVERGGDPPALGAVGVCDDQGKAVRRLAEALREAPAGALGLVHSVTRPWWTDGYWYGDLLVRVQVDSGTGTVVARRGGGQPMDDVFAEAARVCAQMS